MIFPSVKQVSGKGIIYTDTGRVLKWSWLWGCDVELCNENGDTIAHGELRSMGAWTEPEIVKWGDDSLSESEESEFMAVLQELAQYEVDNYRALESAMDRIFNILDALDGHVLIPYDWAEAQGHSVDVVDELATDYMLRSVIFIEFVGDEQDKELCCRADYSEAVWSFAYDKVTGFLQSKY